MFFLLFWKILLLNRIVLATSVRKETRLYYINNEIIFPNIQHTLPLSFFRPFN